MEQDSKIRTEGDIYAEIQELTAQLVPLKDAFDDINLQLVESRASLRAGEEVDNVWRRRAIDALRHNKRGIREIEEKIRRLNIERMRKMQSVPKKVKAQNRFADVFVVVAKANLSREAYDELRRKTNAAISLAGGREVVEKDDQQAQGST